MSGTGLRVLSLDGGGTRGLSSIYILREIMNQVAPGNGGNVRPCEYFDIIGASGPNALSALLFVRFGFWQCFTINESLEYYHDLSRRLDKVEEVLYAGEGEEFDEDDWDNLFNQTSSRVQQLAAIRQQVVGVSWRDVIIKQFTDRLERADYMENGEFNYKDPMAHVGVGRARAAIMGSESPGYGEDGVEDDRVYNAPIWHRSYVGRHTKTTYTFFAVALGTMGSPDIVKTGVIFPGFLATGMHSVHNPVQLLLEECNKIWPGLRAGVIISIGTGNLDVSEETWDFNSHPVGLRAAEACKEIYDDTEKIADEIQTYVLPHDELFRSAYFRFNVPKALPFFEYEARDSILKDTQEWLTVPEPATSLARVAAALGSDGFPSTLEDHVALSSLASLASAFTSTGYAKEAELISDSISTYILYESANFDRGSHRKLLMAVNAGRLKRSVRSRQPWNITGNPNDGKWTSSSDGVYLNSLMAYGNNGPVPEGSSSNHELGKLTSMCDIAAGSYFLLTASRRRDVEELNGKHCQSLVRQLSSYLGLVPDLTPALNSRLETLLRLASLAALCEAATTEALSVEPRLLFNGQLIRYLNTTISESNLEGVSLHVLEPVMNAISTIIHLKKWSSFRDGVIEKLLSCPSSASSDIWSLANLAVEREHMRALSGPDAKSQTECTKLCQQIMMVNNDTFRSQLKDIAQLSVERGYLGLLRKLLEDDQLKSDPVLNQPRACESAASLITSTVSENKDTLLHQSARRGFIATHRMIVECLGTVESGTVMRSLNAGGHTPLQLACIHRVHVNVILLCLSSSAKLNQVSSEGRAALHYCFPAKDHIPEYYTAVMDLVDTHGLLLTLPLQLPRAWGIYGRGKAIDNSTFTLRNIIRKLIYRGADLCIRDHNGSTAAHLAAKEGWGVNMDILFSSQGAEAEKMANTCLRLRDDNNETVLDLVRARGDAEGERIVMAEMRKRCLVPFQQNPQSPTIALQTISPSSATNPGPKIVTYRPTTPLVESLVYNKNIAPERNSKPNASTHEIPIRQLLPASPQYRAPSTQRPLKLPVSPKLQSSLPAVSPQSHPLQLPQSNAHSPASRTLFPS